MNYELTPIDAVLRNFGRNIVNLQRLEQILKALASIQPLNGTFEKIKNDIEKTRKKTLGFTLGQAINVWVDSLDESKSPKALAKDLFDITMCSSFDFGLDSETKVRHAEQLNELLIYRNGLIHSGLAKVDFESESELKAISAELDLWNPKIIEQINFLSPILRAMASIKAEDFEVIESDDDLSGH